MLHNRIADPADNRVDWDDFKFVQAVATTGSVRRAGERLGVHGSTVTRHLEQLEQRVGTRLFARTPRGMEITQAGAEVMEALDRVAAELDQVEHRLQSRGTLASGPVTLALPAPIARDLVVPALDELARELPEVAITLATSPDAEALERGEVDMALWLTDTPPDHLIGRPLASLWACVYGTPAYLSALDAEPASGRWIGTGDPVSLSGRMRARHFPALPPVLTIRHVDVRAAALAAGLGIGLLPCYLGDARADLARAAAVPPARETEAWLFMHPNTRGVASLQAVSAFLQRLFAAHQPRLEGRARDINQRSS